MTEKTNKATLTTSIGTGGHNNKPLNQFEITTVTLSAVEWLQEQYNQCPKYEERIYEQDWEKAKEMEKEQRGYSEEDVREMLFMALCEPQEECCTTHTKDSIVRKVLKTFEQLRLAEQLENEIDNL